MTVPLLDIRNISKAYGATQALSNVSLTVSAGEVHAVVGENGAGKSTLINIVSGQKLTPQENPYRGLQALPPKDVFNLRLVRVLKSEW